MKKTFELGSGKLRGKIGVIAEGKDKDAEGSARPVHVNKGAAAATWSWSA
jgi:hypothetical protein